MIHTLGGPLATLFSVLKRTIVGSVCRCNSCWTFTWLQLVRIQGSSAARRMHYSDIGKNVMHRRLQCCMWQYMTNTNVLLVCAGLPFSHGCSSLSRTSSILSKDHPPDKKPKSDKTSLPSNEFDPTGNFLLSSLFVHTVSFYLRHILCHFSILTLYLCMHHFIWLPHVFVSVPLSTIYFSLSLTHTQTLS